MITFVLAGLLFNGCANESIARRSYGLAAKLETPLGEQLLLVIDTAFLEGMSAALLTCVGVIAIGIVLTALFDPSRAECVAKKAEQTEVSS